MDIFPPNINRAIKLRWMELACHAANIGEGIFVGKLEGMKPTSKGPKHTYRGHH
jgi:hypothetical protein